jgi:hypothetical protein
MAAAWAAEKGEKKSRRVDGNDGENISAPSDSMLIWGRFQRFEADVPKAEAKGFVSAPVERLALISGRS